MSVVSLVKLYVKVWVGAGVPTGTGPKLKTEPVVQNIGFGAVVQFSMRFWKYEVPGANPASSLPKRTCEKVPPVSPDVILVLPTSVPLGL